MPHRPPQHRVRPAMTAAASAVLAIGAIGCGSDDDRSTGPSSTTPAIAVRQVAAGAPSPARGAIAGCDGTWITPGRPAQHVLSLRNYVTEILAGLGAADRTVGQVNAGTFTPLPEVAAAYRRVRVIADQAPSQEQVLAARPDLVVGDGSWAFDGKGVPTQQELVKDGVAPYVIPPACLDARHPAPAFDDTYRMLTDLGTLTGTAEQAGRIVRWGRERIATISKAVAGGPVPRVLAGGVSEGAFYAYDRGSYAPTLRTLGLRNVLPAGTVKADATFAQISAEQVLRWNPDALIITYIADDDLAAQKAYVAKNLRRSRAVRDGRVLYVPEAFFTGGLQTLSRAPAVAFGARGLPVPGALSDSPVPVG
jgi:iron complex transport system substrate-binding protein